MSTPVGVIKKFVKALINTDKQGTDAVDVAFKAVGAVNYDVFKEKFTSAQSGLSTEDFLEQKCGIRVNNKDTGAITGSDAGGKTTKTAESIVPETAKAVSLTKAQYNSFTKNGLKVNVIYHEVSDTDAGENFGYSSATYLAKQKLVTRALYNWWIPESLDLINQSLGINFTDGRASINEINVVFSDDFGNNECATSVEFNYDMGRASEVTLYINSNLLYNMTANDKNGTLDDDKAIWTDFCGYFQERNEAGGRYRNHTPRFSNYLDRIILQSLAEVAIKSNVSYAYYLDEEIRAGLCEIVGGFDNENAFSEWSIEAYVDSNGFSPTYSYGLIRYLAKNYSDGVPDGASYNAKKTILTLTTDYTEDTLDLADFESTVKNVNASALKNGIKIIGNKLDNSILGGAGNDSIVGGDGKDTLSGGKGNDTLKGGKGDDIFVYTAGNDIINDYTTGDKISIGAAISNTKLSGDDVVFTIGKGTLTVKDGANKNLSMINSKGKTFETLVSSATTLTINNKTKSPVTLDANVGTADASKRTTEIKIVGNKLDNVILGGSKADTLYGEAGNDSIQGNAGKDNLYGGFGNDTLKGGADNDKLSGGAGNDYLYGEKGNDTLKGGAGNDII